MKHFVVIFLLTVWLPLGLLAQESSSEKAHDVPAFVQHSTISGQWFLNYHYNVGNDENAFSLSRAYFTVKTKFAKNLTARMTQDLTIDKEGDDKGNVEMRLKYLYMAWQLPDWHFFSGSYFEFGEVHRPWLDYEEHVNPYRVQGTMVIERMHIINSAGFGATFVTLLGAKMDNEYTHTVSHAYPGTYGSFAVGVYNGGGYHALENNINKNVETRLSLRPFGEKLPGFQVSYSGVYGTGNTEDKPLFNLHMAYVSYECRLFIATAQYFTGMGNQGGSLLYKISDGQGAIQILPDEQAGYSGFLQLKIPHTKLAVFGRYDVFETKMETLKHENAIGGISYQFSKKSKLLFDYNQSFTDNDAGCTVEMIYGVALEVHF